MTTPREREERERRKKIRRALPIDRLVTQVDRRDQRLAGRRSIDIRRPATPLRTAAENAARLHKLTAISVGLAVVALISMFAS